MTMDARIRVLVVGQGPPSTGGIPTFVSALLDDPWLGRRVRFEHLNTTPDRTKRPGAGDLGNLVDTLSHARAVLRAARRADVVHLNLCPVPALPLMRAMLLSLAARAGRARVVLHAHTGLMARAMRRAGYRALMRGAIRLVDALAVVSAEAEDAARMLGGPVARIENGVRTDRFRPEVKTLPPTLVFVGTVCERKGLLDLRDALRSLGLGGAGDRRLQVLIVGDGAQEGPGAFARVRSAYRDAGLDGVAFTGPLDRAALARILASASIFCLPSHWEGAPISLLEAMASGAAVIASGVGDVPIILDHGRSGIVVPPGDPKALAAAIDGLVRDADQRARLGEAARRRALRHYDQERMVRRVYETYRRATPVKPPRVEPILIRTRVRTMAR